MLSPLEMMPFEILNRIYGHLKISSWKFPLGQCSKTLYRVFRAHIEQRKADLVGGRASMFYAASWGDPILTQISFDPGKFHNSMFESLCLSGNVALVKYIDAYLFLSGNDFTEEEDLEACGRVGYRHKRAIEVLLRDMTFKIYDQFISPEIVDELLSYFFEDVHQNFIGRYFEAIAGVMEVHGKNTCLYPAFKECMNRLESPWRNIVHREVRKAIIQESFYTGIEEIPSHTHLFTTESSDELSRFLYLCVRYALCSPRKNEENIRKAWNMYINAIHLEPIHTQQIENLFHYSITNDKLDIFNEIAKKYITDHHIPVDYCKIWVSNRYTSSEHLEYWKLDPKTCLIQLLDKHTKKNTAMSYFRKKNTLKRLMKCHPNILHSLTPEEIEKYKYTGLFCPRCLNNHVKYGQNEGTPHQCKYCTHSFPSKADPMVKMVPIVSAK